MYDQEVKDLQTLLRSLLSNLSTIEQQKNQTQDSQKYSELRKKEKEISHEIEKNLETLCEKLNNLEERERSALKEVLKTMETFINKYGEESDDLCINLKNFKKQFIIDNSSLLKRLYQNIWRECGFENFD